MGHFIYEASSIHFWGVQIWGVPKQYILFPKKTWLLHKNLAEIAIIFEKNSSKFCVNESGAPFRSLKKIHKILG